MFNISTFFFLQGPVCKPLAVCIQKERIGSFFYQCYTFNAAFLWSDQILFADLIFVSNKEKRGKTQKGEKKII